MQDDKSPFGSDSIPALFKHPLELFIDAVECECDLPLISADEPAEVNRVITVIYNAHEDGGWAQF